MNNFPSQSFVFLSLVLFILWSSGCIRQKESKLPIYGEKSLSGQDTLYHTIKPFRFINQDSLEVTEETFSNKIYITDFFFTTCRTICPIMKSQMLRVYDSIKFLPDVLLLSHTIDPDYDTVNLLHNFANSLGVSSDKWHFVTGDKSAIYGMALNSYFVTTMEDPTEPDGFIHSGAFMLIDKQKRIRGKYDGTKEDDVDRLIRDIHILRKEQESTPDLKP